MSLGSTSILEVDSVQKFLGHFDLLHLHFAGIKHPHLLHTLNLL